MRWADVHSGARGFSLKRRLWAEEDVPDCLPFSSLRQFDVCTFPRRCCPLVLFLFHGKKQRGGIREAKLTRMCAKCPFSREFLM